MTFQDAMEAVVVAFEVAGVAVLAVGSVLSVVVAAVRYREGRPGSVYEQVRQGVGRAILLGLEILIIADIVQTITVDPTLESAATLGIIVLVRVVLSFSLEIELDGQLPWRRGGSGADA